ncbi:MAG: hypothetical protein WC592_07510 [Candidatus Omnitrophota bacterium]
MPSRIRGKKGFLLLEVMISIIILTGGLLFVTRVYSTAKIAIQRSKALFKYSLLLEEAMFEIEEKGEAEKGRNENEFKDDRDYLWASNVTAIVEDDREDPNLNAVTMDVYRKKGSGADRYSITSFIGKPQK